MRASLPVSDLAKMYCGLFGVQIAWGLQNANTSRIFQTLGANVAELPILWIAGPITGLLVQPIVGYLSDRTWTPLGRRRPYVLAGSLVGAFALVLMPQVESLWAAIAMLWLLTGALNVAMEPFRALVADSVPEHQRTAAFALQGAFLGFAAVLASALPWLLGHGFGVAADGPPGRLPPAVRMGFDIGAAGLLAGVLVTVLTTRERPFSASEDAASEPPRPPRGGGASIRLILSGALWVLGGVALAAVTAALRYRAELYLVAGVSALFGLANLALALSTHRDMRPTGLLEILDDFIHMPNVLRRLAVVQFFTWFGLFAMWIYAVPSVVANAGLGAGGSGRAYNAVADWVGVMFAFYNGVAVLAALALPRLVASIGRREAHAVCLALGAAGLAGFGLIHDPSWLWAPSIGIGCAWASILSIPYAMVSSAARTSQMGVYMGIHNVFLVLPQIVATVLLGWLVEHLFRDRASLALMLAAAALVAASLFSLTIPDRAGRRSQQA
jgi:maltose/moltooligosaccharide transporter